MVHFMIAVVRRLIHFSVWNSCCFGVDWENCRIRSFRFMIRNRSS